MTNNFEFIRDADKPNLDTLIGQFEVHGINAELRGSAARHSSYQDIDFFATPIRRMPDVLKKLGVRHAHVETYDAGTLYVGELVTDRYQFTIGVTKFDVSGNRLKDATDVTTPSPTPIFTYIPT